MFLLYLPLASEAASRTVIPELTQRGFLRPRRIARIGSHSADLPVITPCPVFSSNHDTGD
jgi:hypothetical protein